MKAVHTAWHDFQRSTLAILQASSCRRISACARRSACFAARAALRRVRALVAARLPPCSEHDSRLDSLGEPPCSKEPRTRGGRIDADAEISADAEPTVARQDCEQSLDDVQLPLGGHVTDHVIAHGTKTW